MDRIDTYRNNLNRLIDVDKVLKKRGVTIKKMAGDLLIDYKQLISFRKNKGGKGAPLGENNRIAIAKYLGVAYAEMCGDVPPKPAPEAGKDKLDVLIDLMNNVVEKLSGIERGLIALSEKEDPTQPARRGPAKIKRRL